MAVLRILADKGNCQYRENSCAFYVAHFSLILSTITNNHAYCVCMSAFHSIQSCKPETFLNPEMLYSAIIWVGILRKVPHYLTFCLKRGISIEPPSVICEDQ